jgi:hypothetical protein
MTIYVIGTVVVELRGSTMVTTETSGECNPEIIASLSPTPLNLFLSEICYCCLSVFFSSLSPAELFNQS